MMLNWFKKKRVLPRWRLIGILMIAILFGMTLQISMESGSYGYAILVALCGLGFAYDIE
tara:strand:- start:391 stop:567 length:177 start_codon:yes stop_codon:yes gene_type:complete